MFRLDGHVALVTGGGRGLGRAAALALAGAGADVAVGSRSDAQVREVACEISALDRRALGRACDVTDEEAVGRMLEACRRELGSPTILVNAAGNSLVKPLVPLPGRHFSAAGPVSDREWASIIDTHLTGAMHCIRAAAPDMLDAGFGRVINISSITTRRPLGHTAAYDAAKGALNSLTRSLAKDWARSGVTVNAIAPGQFRTDMTATLHDDDHLRERLVARIPMRRFGTPEEVGALAVFLASAEASYLTGQCIYLDGGESL